MGCEQPVAARKMRCKRINEACTNKKSGSSAAAIQTHVYQGDILDEDKLAVKQKSLCQARLAVMRRREVGALAVYAYATGLRHGTEACTAGRGCSPAST